MITWIKALRKWSYELHCARPPKTDMSWWRVLTKCSPLEKGMANHFSILAMKTPWTIWKGKKIWNLKISPQGQEVSNVLLWKSRKKWRGRAKAEMLPVCGESGAESKVWCCKEQYCIGTWNQDKLDVIKQEMAIVNINILGISEWKWTGMGEFNSWLLYLLLLWTKIPYKEWTSSHSQQETPKCSTWVQSQKTTSWFQFVPKANHSTPC